MSLVMLLCSYLEVKGIDCKCSTDSAIIGYCNKYCVLSGDKHLGAGKGY